MSDMDKLAAEMLAGLEGTTDGLWFVEQSGPGMGDMRVYAHFIGNKSGTRAIGLIAPQKGDQNAEHIARCNPVNIKALLDERAADKTLMRQMAEALDGMLGK